MFSSLTATTVSRHSFISYCLLSTNFIRLRMRFTRFLTKQNLLPRHCTVPTYKRKPQLNGGHHQHEERTNNAAGGRTVSRSRIPQPPPSSAPSYRSDKIKSRYFSIRPRITFETRGTQRSQSTEFIPPPGDIHAHKRNASPNFPFFFPTSHNGHADRFQIFRCGLPRPVS